MASEESTTPDLEELGRQAFEALSRGDLDTFLTYVAPDAVWDFVDTGVGTFAGGAVIRDTLEGWFGAFDDLAFELEEILDLGNGVTFAVVNQRARLAGSPQYVRRREASVGVWQDRLISRVTTYLDIDEARAAAERLAEEREEADV